MYSHISASEPLAMTDQDNSYRPRSPDFSSGFAGNGHSFQDSYNQNPYIFSNSLSPQASYDASPFFNSPASRVPQPPPPPPPYLSQSFAPTPGHEMPPQTRSRTRASHPPQQPQAQPTQQFQPFQQSPPSLHHPAPPQPRQHHRQQQQFSNDQQQFSDDQQQFSNGQQQLPHAQKEQLPYHPQTQQQPPPVESFPPTYPLPTADETPSKPPPQRKLTSHLSGIEVKTKFPVARIKRIMQADEDVGKVAQVTPIAVSKALELFMISLVTKASQQAKDRSSKRITAGHLKEAIAKDDVLDFLADIISKVPDQPGRNNDDGSDHNEKPKKKAGNRRKKDEDDDF
ncbi:hypothetical protein FQN57_005924 [Myotisia sp. PD_48]|nr:hypothetical protein FQN57_005924 [Myotisia sp. PD_48]